MGFTDIAKQAHRAVCPMINCVDCLFGVCDNDCDYQIQFEQELKELLDMSKKMIINVPCKKCKSSQCEVTINEEGWMSILCVECGEVIAEGYASSPWELLKSI